MFISVIVKTDKKVAFSGSDATEIETSLFFILFYFFLTESQFSEE